MHVSLGVSESVCVSACVSVCLHLCVCVSVCRTKPVFCIKNMGPLLKEEINKQNIVSIQQKESG